MKRPRQYFFSSRHHEKNTTGEILSHQMCNKFEKFIEKNARFSPIMRKSCEKCHEKQYLGIINSRQKCILWKKAEKNLISTDDSSNYAQKL